jgi:hypothetical protein
MDEVDEGIPNIAFVPEINGKVKEIEEAFMSLIDEVKHHLLMVFVRYVLDH